MGAALLFYAMDMTRKILHKRRIDKKQLKMTVQARGETPVRKSLYTSRIDITRFTV